MMTRALVWMIILMMNIMMARVNLEESWLQELLHLLRIATEILSLICLNLVKSLISNLLQFWLHYESSDLCNLWNLRKVDMKFWVDTGIKDQDPSQSHKWEIIWKQLLIWSKVATTGQNQIKDQKVLQAIIKFKALQGQFLTIIPLKNTESFKN